MAGYEELGTPEDINKVTALFYVRSLDRPDPLIGPRQIGGPLDVLLIPAKPGRYEISDWVIFGRTQRSVSSDSPYNFEVQPGVITYVGKIQAKVERLNNKFGMKIIPSVTAVLEDHIEEDSKLLKDRFPSAAHLEIVNEAPIRHDWTGVKSKAENIVNPIIVPNQ